jgi:hypothetical protein
MDLNRLARSGFVVGGWEALAALSALPPVSALERITDPSQKSRHVRNVPEADVKLKPGVPADIDSRRRKHGWHSLNNDHFFRVWLRPHHKEVVA